MGRIFLARDVIEGKIPSRDSFKEVMSTIRKELEAREEVAGALFFGSVLTPERLTCRSDIDCLILGLRRRSIVALRPMLQNISQYARARHVPVEWLIVDQRIATFHGHPIGSLLFSHLRYAAQQGAEAIIKEDPTIRLSACMRNGDEKQDAINYCARKLHKIRKALAQFPNLNEWEIAELCKNIIAAPHHAMRKVLYVVHTLDVEGNSILNMATTCRELSPDILKLYAELCKVDQAYTCAVSIKKNSPSNLLTAENYRRVVLHNVIQKAETAERFFRKCIKALV